MKELYSRYLVMKLPVDGVDARKYHQQLIVSLKVNIAHKLTGQVLINRRRALLNPHLS